VIRDVIVTRQARPCFRNGFPALFELPRMNDLACSYFLDARPLRTTRVDITVTKKVADI
jgi:hypothetical protein